MNRKMMTISTLVSTLSGAVAALLVCLGFFFYLNYFDKPARTAELSPKVEEAPVPTPKKAADSIPFDREIKESEVESLTIKTVYPNFFDESSGCRQTYNERFGNADGVYSSGSPCSIEMSFSRDGRAAKTIVTRRYDTRAKQWTSIENKIWEAKITDGQFERLTAAVVGSEGFKSWRDGTSLYVSNCSVSVKHKDGTRTPMMNLDNKTNVLPEMVDAFKKLETALAWQRKS